MPSEPDPWAGRLRARKGQAAPAPKRKIAVPASKKRKLDVAASKVGNSQVESVNPTIDAVVRDTGSRYVNGATQTMEEPMVSGKRKYDDPDGPASSTNYGRFDESEPAEKPGQVKSFMRLGTAIERIHDGHDYAQGDYDPDYTYEKRNCIIRVVDVTEKCDRIVEKATHFMVDRKVIASASRFFAVMMCSTAWADTGKEIIELHEIDATVVRVILCIAAGVFNQLDAAHHPRRRGTLIRKTIHVCLDDAISILISAQAYLLDEAATQTWIDMWMNESDQEPAYLRFELGLAYAYHRDEAERFSQVAAQYIIAHPLNQPIRQELVDAAASSPILPACIYNKLETVRNLAVGKFVRDIDSYFATIDTDLQAKLIAVLPSMRLKFDGQRLTGLSALQQYWNVHAMLVFGYANYYIAEPGYHDYTKLLRDLAVELSSLCLDCVNESIINMNKDDSVWVKWARRPMPETCRQVHGEQVFRNSVACCLLNPNRVLEIRRHEQGCEWVEEIRRFNRGRRTPFDDARQDWSRKLSNDWMDQVSYRHLIHNVDHIRGESVRCTWQD